MSEVICEKCGGSGWIIHEKDGITAAERCKCVAASASRTALESAQIPPQFSNSTFETFNTRSNPVVGPVLSNAFRAALTYVREFPPPDKPGLLFIGDPGAGKTHLAVAVLRGIIAKGFPGIFFDYQNLLDRIRASYSEVSGLSDREAYRTALEAPVLLLDDLGANRVTDWVEDTVTSIITTRYNHRKATIVTTNLADADAGMTIYERAKAHGEHPRSKITLAERIGSRARSRLFEMCRIVRIEGVPDYRVQNAIVR